MFINNFYLFTIKAIPKLQTFNFMSQTLAMYKLNLNQLFRYSIIYLLFFI